MNNLSNLNIKFNEKKGVVTAITDREVIEPVTMTLSNGYEMPVGLTIKNKKEVTLAKTTEGDEFDPYVGAALAIVYQIFGSRHQFRKYIDKKMAEQKGE